MTATGKRIRVYADASVYGGAFDEEFRVASREFFDAVRANRFQLVVSTVVRNELKAAPERVSALFEEMQRLAEDADVSEESVLLQQAYLAAGIIGPQWDTDALHVAIATESQCRDRQLELQAYRQFQEDSAIQWRQPRTRIRPNRHPHTAGGDHR